MNGKRHGKGTLFQHDGSVVLDDEYSAVAEPHNLLKWRLGSA